MNATDYPVNHQKILQLIEILQSAKNTKVHYTPTARIDMAIEYIDGLTEGIDKVQEILEDIIK